MGVLFSKPKSRSNSLISLQNLNMREPGASGEDVQVLLQKNLNPRYDSTAVAIPIERNAQVAKNPQAENYFLSNEAVWGRVFSFCSMTDLLQMRLMSRFFTKIMQDYNQDDHVSLLRHIISFISIIQLFSLGRDQDQASYILFSRSPTAIRRAVIINPFVSHNQDAIDISGLRILLRNALKIGSLFPIASENVSNDLNLNALSNINKNIQEQHVNVGGRDCCYCEQQLLSFRGGKWMVASLRTLIVFAMLTLGVMIPVLIKLFVSLCSGESADSGMKYMMVVATSILFFGFLAMRYCFREGHLPKNFSKTITATKEEPRAIFERLKDDIQFFKNKLNPPIEEATKRTDSIAVPIP